MKNSYCSFTVFAFALLAACALFHTQPAQAADITETEAQRLEGVFQNIFEEKKAAITAQTPPPYELILKGDVTVETAETYYAITLPELSLRYPGGSHVDIGMISLNATPHDKAGRYKMTMAIPTPVLGFDAAGREVMRISIANQSAAGIWDEELQNFIKLNATYSGIQISNIRANSETTLQDVRIRYDLEEGENGRLSGPMHFEADDIKTSFSQNMGAETSLEKMSLSLNLDKVSPEILKKRADKSIIPVLEYGDGADLKLSLHGFNAFNNAPDGAQEALSFKQTDLNFSYKNTLDGSINADFSLGFDGIATSNMSQGLTPFIPKSGQLKLRHYNIPLTAINETIMNSRQGRDPSLLGVHLLLKLPAIMAQAESYMELYETGLQNENYNINLDTLIKADNTAVNSATATGHLRFAGLNKTLSLAQNTITKADPQYIVPLTSLALFLERLKPVARIENDEMDNQIHVFDLEMDKTGQFLLNGQNALFLLNSSPQRIQQQAPALAPETAPESGAP